MVLYVWPASKRYNSFSFFGSLSSRISVFATKATRADAFPTSVRQPRLMTDFAYISTLASTLHLIPKAGKSRPLSVSLTLARPAVAVCFVVWSHAPRIDSAAAWA